MISRAKLVAACFATALMSTSALADSHRWATLGIGTHAGYASQTPAADAGSGGFVYGMDVRAKLLYVFGFELQMNGGGATVGDTGERSMLTPKYRANAHLYIVPLNPVDIYLTAGVGANTGGDLVDVVNGKTASLQGGAGIEYAWTKSLTFALDFVMMAPGVNYLRENAKSQVQEQTGAGQVAQNAQQNGGQFHPKVEKPALLSLSNWNTNLGVRYYF